MVFIGTTPKRYYCAPPPGFEPNQTVPGYGDPEEESCLMYAVHDGIVTGNKTKCTHGWMYDTEYGETTIVMDVSDSILYTNPEEEEKHTFQTNQRFTSESLSI